MRGHSRTAAPPDRLPLHPAGYPGSGHGWRFQSLPCRPCSLDWKRGRPQARHALWHRMPGACKRGDFFICGINIIEPTINFHALPHKVLNRLRRLRGWLFCVLRRNDALRLRFRNLEISGVEVAFKGIAVDADGFLSGYVR